MLRVNTIFFPSKNNENCMSYDLFLKTLIFELADLISQNQVTRLKSNLEGILNKHTSIS